MRGKLFLLPIIILFGFFSVNAFSGNGNGSNLPYEITNCTQLQEMQDENGVNYVLMNDINCSDSINWNGGEGFKPIGNESVPTSVYLEGGGHAIYNLYINRPGEDNVGLFGYLLTSSGVFNFSLIDMNITGQDNVGGIVGYIEDSEINHCFVSGKLDGRDNLGGLVGKMRDDVSIGNSHSSVNVNGQNYLGGLVGSNSGIIENSYATGNVMGSSSVGGLVGIHQGGAIENSYSSGDVSAGVNSAGGLVGYSVGNFIINNSYATGDVFVGNDGGGGFVGIVDAGNGVIENCYSTGGVSGVGMNYGFVGEAIGGTEINSFYDINTSGKADSGGMGIGKTTDEMKNMSTFINVSWNIQPSLTNLNNGYPYFGWQENNETTWLIVLGEEPVTCSVCNETCSPCGGGCTATDLSWMYNSVANFDTIIGDITGWNTSCIKDISYMFYMSDFNQDISDWDTSNVTGMIGVFNNDGSFNQDISDWDTSSVIDMSSMFGSTPFNQDISSWDVSQVTAMTDMFLGVTLSIENYDALLNGWSSLSLQSGVILGGGNSRYSSTGKVGRDVLTDTYDWIITDGGLWEIDTISPNFTIIPPNVSIFYGNESLLVKFEGEDETVFDSYFVNDTTNFSINSSGFLSNKTSLAVGNYEINVTINDTSNNINWSIFNVNVKEVSEVISTPIKQKSSGGGGGGSTKKVVVVEDNQTNQTVQPIQTIQTVSPSENEFQNPSQLFDIKLELESANIENSSELSSVIRFESFGSVPTFVDLTYTIIDSSGNEIYKEKGNISVTTEQIVRKNFENVDLSDGEYTLVLTTVYGENVTDEFRQEFVVAGKSSNSRIYFIIGIISIFLIGILMAIYTGYRVKLRDKNGENNLKEILGEN